MQQHAGDNEKRKASESRWRWIRRPVVWIGSLATAVITAVAVSLTVFFTNHAIGVGQANVHPTQSPHGPPVVVAAVKVLRNAAYQGYSFVFPKPLDLTRPQLQSINRLTSGLQIGGLNHYYAWAREHHGVDPNVVIIQLVLAGNRNQPVRILGMQPVGECRAPLAGTLFDSPPAAEDNSVSIGFNLDKPDPAAQVYSETTGFGADYFSSKTVSLRYQKQQVFQIVARTAKHYCKFRLQLSVLAGGKTSTETIGDGPHPFQVTGLLPASSNSVDGYKRAYVGGVLSPCGSRFVQVNPARFHTYPIMKSLC